MSNRNDIWNLLLTRVNQWVSRDSLAYVGGTAYDRRMREIREDVVRSGRYRLEIQEGKHREVKAVRLVEIQAAETENTRYLWRCKKCQSHPTEYAMTQPSIDPRWRIGKCDICRDKQAVFARVVSP